MLKFLLARIQQGHRTSAWPDAPPSLPDRLRGRPTIDPVRCPSGCQRCVEACPTGAISDARAGGARGPAIDLGRCLFCTACTEACPEGAIRFGDNHRLAARDRDSLIVRGGGDGAPSFRALDDRLRRLFGRSLKLRQVSAGGCNACESDVNVLSTVGFDLGRFGIQVVASPRHADGLLITGPVTENMKLALAKTWAAVPSPKIAIAVGACAISGGPFAGHPEVHDGAAGIVPIDLYLPGCPPHPYTILDGMLRLLGRIEERREQERAAAVAQGAVDGVERVEPTLRKKAAGRR